MKLIITILMLFSLINQQLDKPYNFGSAGPSSFDCSGFVVFCYKEILDIDLPHSAQRIGYLDDYKKIENQEDLIFGDIVCFNTVRDKDLSDHVGIYLYNSEFVHSSSGKRKVIISSLSEEYYNKNFSWGIRILNN